MFILSPTTIWNGHVLETRSLPCRVLGRVMILPRRGASVGFWARLIFEVELLRYLVSLLPFVAAAVIWPRYALAIAQAPLLMFIAIYLVEMKALRLSPAARAGLLSEADADRGRDLLRVRAMAILTRIAAGRGLTTGQLHLVVEQAAMARIAPLTLVSVQTDDGPAVLDLTDTETALIRGALFQPPLDERRLLLISLQQDEGLHQISLDLRGIPAHARLAALLAG